MNINCQRCNKKLGEVAESGLIQVKNQERRDNGRGEQWTSNWMYFICARCGWRGTFHAVGYWETSIMPLPEFYQRGTKILTI